MENNKILFLTISVIAYTLLVIFIGKAITKNLKKIAVAEENFNNYAIIFSGFFLSAAIIGKELFGVLSDAFSILLLSNSDNSAYFNIISVFIISGLIMLIIAFYVAQALLKIIFDNIKITEKYSTDQFGYFLLFGILIIALSIICTPLYYELLILFSPKIEAGLYN